MISFPFANDTSPECGLLILHDCGDPHHMKTPRSNWRAMEHYCTMLKPSLRLIPYKLRTHNCSLCWIPIVANPLKIGLFPVPALHSSLFNESRATCSYSNATALSIFLPLKVLIEQIAVTMTSIIVLHIII